jgi:hypothetical protein
MQKGRNRDPLTVDIPLNPELQSVIDASPTGDLTFLITEQGRPFTAPGFTNWFRKRCKEASIPNLSAHGLRKAAATRAAERGATTSELMGIFGGGTLAKPRSTRARPNAGSSPAEQRISSEQIGLKSFPLQSSRCRQWERQEQKAEGNQRRLSVMVGPAGPLGCKQINRLPESGKAVHPTASLAFLHCLYHHSHEAFRTSKIAAQAEFGEKIRSTPPR